MTVLSLDLSTKSSGWAIYQDSKLIDSGYITATSTNVYNRIQKITSELELIVKKYNPTKVYSEQPEPASVGNNMDVYRKLTFMHGDVCIMLNHYQLRMELCTSSHWRSLVGIKTGRGIKRDSLKPKDIAKVKQIFNKTCNDDQADAILIGLAYVKQNGCAF